MKFFAMPHTYQMSHLYQNVQCCAKSNMKNRECWQMKSKDFGQHKEYENDWKVNLWSNPRGFSMVLTWILDREAWECTLPWRRVWVVVFWDRWFDGWEEEDWVLVAEWGDPLLRNNQEVDGAIARGSSNKCWWETCNRKEFEREECWLKTVVARC